MNQEMFGTLPSGATYTKRRNLWTRPKVNVVTYKGYECEKWTCGIGRTNDPKIDALAAVGPVGRETHFTVSYDYIMIVRERGTTNPMMAVYNDGYATEGRKWFGQVRFSGNGDIAPCDDWKHQKLTYYMNVDKGQAVQMNFFPAYLRDIDADLYIRNIMICYGDEDYPYTPAPEIDETVVLTEGAG